MKAQVQLNQDGKWTVVKNGEVLGTFDTIKAAMDAKFELSRKPVKVQYFRADGSEVTRKPRQRAA
jgi:hypothetical protein